MAFEKNPRNHELDELRVVRNALYMILVAIRKWCRQCRPGPWINVDRCEKHDCQFFPFRRGPGRQREIWRRRR